MKHATDKKVRMILNNENKLKNINLSVGVTNAVPTLYIIVFRVLSL